jgi:hypothetical protein
MMMMMLMMIMLMMMMLIMMIALKEMYLKWMLRTQTVTKMERVMRIMVKMRYFPGKMKKKVQKNMNYFLICKFRNFFLLPLPSRGTARDVGGMISAKRRKNTVRESRIEMQRVTCRKNYQL